MEGDGDLTTYTCPKCKAPYPHDQGYRHEMYECPYRNYAGSPADSGGGVHASREDP